MKSKNPSGRKKKIDLRKSMLAYDRNLFSSGRKVKGWKVMKNVVFDKMLGGTVYCKLKSK